jgi:hypothetical protein
LAYPTRICQNGEIGNQSRDAQEKEHIYLAHRRRSCFSFSPSCPPKRLILSTVLLPPSKPPL